MISRSKSGKLPPKRACLAQISSALTVETLSVSVVLIDPLWKAAMDYEFQDLLKNGTRTLVPYDSARVKQKYDGILDKCQARLVAKGFQQVVFAIVVSKKWPIHQIYVNNSFLNDDMNHQRVLLIPKNKILFAYFTKPCMV